MTLSRRHRALARARHRRVRREDAGRAGQCTKVDPEATGRGRRTARLRRDGRHRRRHQHRRGPARRHRRRDRLRRRGRRRDRRRPLAGAHDDHRRRRRRPEARVGEGVRRHAHRQRQRAATPSRRSASSPAASAPTSSSTRSAGPRRSSRRSTPATWPARVVLVGVPTPDMTLELPLIEVFGRGGALKSSWYGDCLPSRDFPMLVDLYLQGRFAAGHVRDRDHRRSTTSRRRSTRCTAATCCARWWCSERGSRIEHLVTSGTFSLDGGTFDVDNNVWLVGDDDECSSSTPRTTPRRSRPPSATGASSRSCAPTRTTTTSTPPRSSPSARRAGPAAPRRPGAVGPDLARPRARRRARGRRSRRRRHRRCGCCTRRATPRASACLYVPDLGVVFTGDTLFEGGPGRPGGRTATYPRSSTRSAAGCSPLPPETTVRTGHGDETTVGAEAPHLRGVDRARPLGSRPNLL